MVKAMPNMPASSDPPSAAQHEEVKVSVPLNGDLVIVDHSKPLQSSKHATSDDLEDSEDDSSSDDDFPLMKPQPKLSDEKDLDYTPPTDEICATR